MEKYVMAVVAALQFLSLNSLLHSNTVVIAQSDDIDFTYMKSVVNATDMPLESEHDYIVIGGGTAGCPIAATLSSKYKILVLERGGLPLDNPNVMSAGGFVANLMEEDNGNTAAEKFTSEDGVVNARGRVLGGTSMINAGFYSRGDEEFYEVSGIDWDKDVVEESYEWVEDSVAHRSDMLPWQSAVREALLEAQVGPDNEFTLNHVVGTKTSASTFDRFGRRHGAVQLLNKAKLSNLKVAVHAYVDKIIFSSSQAHGLSATGVKYRDSNGRSHEATIHNKGEIILSAGALGSPQLLLLSGIGPQSYLSSNKIPLLHHLPHVGEFVYDNPRNGISFTPPFGLDASYLQIVGIMEHQYIETISIPNPFSFPQPYGLLSPISSPVNLDLGLIAAKIDGPLSVGSFVLGSSTEVKISPKVRYNYYSNPLDLARCVVAMRKIGQMLNSASLDRFKFESSTGGRDFKFIGPMLPTNQTDDASMEAFCRETVTTIWHYHGGCVAGKVVDRWLRVEGIEGLRVVDGSTFTVSPGTNPQATVMMLGRYMGLKIMEQRTSLGDMGSCKVY